MAAEWPLNRLGIPEPLVLQADGSVLPLAIRLPTGHGGARLRLSLRSGGFDTRQAPRLIEATVGGRLRASLPLEPGKDQSWLVPLEPQDLSTGEVLVILSTTEVTRRDVCQLGSTGQVEIAASSVLAMPDAPASPTPARDDPPLDSPGRFAAELHDLIRQDHAAPRPVATDTRHDRLMLGHLGQTPPRLSVTQHGSWTFDVPAWHLPPSMAVKQVAIDLTAPGQPATHRLVARATLNGVVLGNWSLLGGQRKEVLLELPNNLVGTRNRLRVDVQRQAADGSCLETGDSGDVALAASSGFTLQRARPEIEFHQLAGHFAQGLEVVIPSLDFPPAVAHRLLAGLVHPQARLSVAVGASGSRRPRVVFSEEKPERTRPHLHLDRGPVRLMSATGSVLADEASMAHFAVAQVLDDDGSPVLWIRPGPRHQELSGLPSWATLGSGHIALIEPSRVALAFHTRHDRVVSIEYPQRPSWAERILSHRVLILAPLWILTSLGLLWLLRQVRRARQRPM